MSSVLIIGLTGGIASGKTTVANYLAERGAYLIDTDIIARQVVEPNMPATLAIRDLLGEDFLHPDGSLNRAKIKARIFNDSEIMAQYEAIILPAIRQATVEALDAVKHMPKPPCYALLIVPLLFEKGLDAYCDYTMSVDIPVEVQIERAIARKPSDEGVIRQIIAQQMPREERNARADFIVDNTVSLQVLQQQLEQLHARLLQLT